MNIPDIIELLPNRVWRTYQGGKLLDQAEGKSKPEDSHFPEDWIGSTTKATNQGREHLVDEGISRVSIDKQSFLLTELIDEFPSILIGSEHHKKYGSQTGFLLKFLDSSIRLHIQVHPTKSFSRQFLDSDNGKTEAYVILEVRKEIDDPYIYMGFQNPPERESFKNSVENQDIESLTDCFEKITVSPGDVFIVPGGLPHAIGPGVLMIEIMEPTDFVGRLEFERGGYLLPEASRFMNRGIDFALDMIRFEALSVETIKSDYFSNPRIFAKQDGGYEVTLIDEQQTSCFGVNRLHISKSFTKKSSSFYIGIVTAGSGVVKTPNCEIQLKKGSRFFIPFSTDSVVYIADDMLEIVLTSPPK